MTAAENGEVVWEEIAAEVSRRKEKGSEKKSREPGRYR